jgi:hypothetical protein
MLKNNLSWFPCLEKLEMKEGDENFEKELHDIYFKILMRSRYKIIEQKLIKTTKVS